MLPRLGPTPTPCFRVYARHCTRFVSNARSALASFARAVANQKQQREEQPLGATRALGSIADIARRHLAERVELERLRAERASARSSCRTRGKPDADLPRARLRPSLAGSADHQ